MESRHAENIAIVSRELIPDIDPPEDQEPIQISITGNTELTFDQEAVVDVESELLALNALLVNRGKALRSEELQEKIEPASPKAFKKQLGAIAAKLFRATEMELIEVTGPTGGTMTYQLSPRITLVDERDKPKEDNLTTLRRQAEKAQKEDTLSAALIRKKTLTAIVRDYAKQSKVRYDVLFSKSNASATLSRHALYETWPKKEECEQYITEIEAGINAVLNQTDNVDETLSTLMSAYHTLYYQHLYPIHGLAEKYRSQWASYEDLFQEGSLALIEFIIDYASRVRPLSDSPTSDENPFTSEALVAIARRMSHVDNFEHDSELPEKTRIRKQSIILTTELFLQEHGRHPTFDEIATLTSMKKQIVIEALADVRQFTEIMEHQQEPIDQSLDTFTTLQKVHDILAEEAITEREKIIISLYYGLFTTSLSGARFTAIAKDADRFVYPYSIEDMPENTTLSMNTISRLLRIETAKAYAILHSGLAKGRSILSKKGVDSLEDWW